MERLIDADKFIEWLGVGHLRSPTEPCMSELNVKKAIELQPTVNAVPVVRGEWILIGRGRITKSRDLKCSVCGNYFRVYDDVTLNAGRGDANFCPSCGAKMDKEAQT